MSSMIGQLIKLSVWGESHGEAIGVVIDGIPSGKTIDLQRLQDHCDRRKSGDNAYSTPRKEADKITVLSGILNGVTTGAPISISVANTNLRSQDYASVCAVPRPSHSDYPAAIKYNNCNDIRGGGHFSGRLTLPLVIAGGIAEQILADKSIRVKAYISAPNNGVSYKKESIETILDMDIADKGVNAEMLAQIAAARADGDSLGGVIECVTDRLPVGLGEPMYDGMESLIAQYIFAIPAVKGLEFGSGFALADMRGSAANDEYIYDNGTVKTLSNYNGGLCGGLTNGSHLTLRLAIKPTPSISKPQNSINLTTGENVTLEIKGRHDACIAPRAVVVVESAVALAILEAMMQDNARRI